jgi:hypothetical protein
VIRYPWWDIYPEHALALVWVTFHLAPAWPRECRPLPRHSHASLDDRYVRPVIRSRIPGGRTSYPLLHPPTFP